MKATPIAVALLAACGCFVATAAVAAEPATGEAVEGPRGLPRSAAQTYAASVAYAVPMKPPMLDGRFDEWPAHAPRFPVLNNYRVYGPTDIDEADLTDNADLSAWFMVGYSVEENLVYVAVTVRDEKIVVGRGYDRTDAIEICIQAPHTHERRVIMPAGIGLTALQYSAVPGEGSTSVDDGSPGMVWGDVTKTRTRIAFARDEQAGVTTYEFAVEPYTLFTSLKGGTRTAGGDAAVGDEPAKLEAGMRLGFDLSVVDKDETYDVPSYIAWGPIGAEKYFNPTILGDLILVGDDGLAPLTGKAVGSDGGARGGVALQIYDSKDEPAGVVTTGDDGRYRFSLPPGEYRVAPAGSQCVQRDTWHRVIVAAEKGGAVDLTVDDLDVPPPLARAIERYATIERYADETTVSVAYQGEVGQMRMGFDFVRPNQVRIDGPRDTVLVTRDGHLRTEREGRLQGEAEAAEHITEHALSQALASLEDDQNMWLRLPTLTPKQGRLPALGLLGGLPVHRALMSGEPKRVLIGEADTIKSVGQKTLGEESFQIVEITRPASQFLPQFPYGGEERGEMMAVRYWISERDGLIRRTQFDFDFLTTSHSAFRARSEQKPVIVRYTFDHKARPADGGE